MNVALIKMGSGEDVVAELVREEDDVLVINNPIVMVPQGQQVGFAPWSPFLADSVNELVIRRSYVVYVSEPKAEVAKNYTEIFSPIITPKGAGKIIT